MNKYVKFFFFDAILIKFESKHFHMLIINKYLQYEKREKKNFESDNVLDSVWDNHYDERSRIKSLAQSHLRICRTPPQKW